jgi:hypothetical protein
MACRITTRKRIEMCDVMKGKRKGRIPTIMRSSWMGWRMGDGISNQSKKGGGRVEEGEQRRCGRDFDVWWSSLRFLAG